MQKQGRPKNETILSTDRVEKSGKQTLDRTLLSTLVLLFAASGLNEPFFGPRVKRISPVECISFSRMEWGETMVGTASAGQKESANRPRETIHGLFPQRSYRAAGDAFWGMISVERCLNKKIRVYSGVKRVHFDPHRTKVLFFDPLMRGCSPRLSFLRSYG